LLGKPNSKKSQTKRDEQGASSDLCPDRNGKIIMADWSHEIDLNTVCRGGGFRGYAPPSFMRRGRRNGGHEMGTFIWNDKILHIRARKFGQKRIGDIPLQAATSAWLKHSRPESEIWINKHRK